jgi:Na+/H+-dicarboxylate symporter
MHSTISNKQLKFVTRFRPILIAYAIVSTTLVVGIDLWHSIGVSNLASVLYNVVFAIMFLGLVGMITFSGYKMIVVMRSMWEHTRHIAHLLFLRKVNKS